MDIAHYHHLLLVRPKGFPGCRCSAACLAAML